MKNIFDETKLNQLELKNRIFRSATWLALADDEGNLNEKIFEIYRELSEGGVAAIVTGITTISPHDALIDGIAQFHSDKFISQHKKFTEMIHANDCKIFLQTAIVDSVFYIGDELYQIPIAKLTEENISEVVELFKNAAIRAKNSGYDGIQLHAAHGFFLSQFISPLYNDSENRAEILGKILDSVREVVGKKFCVIAKINCEDFQQGGLNLKNCIEACKIMENHGIDAIEISGNFTSRRARAFHGEGYFKAQAIEIKKNLNIPVILVGGHRSVEEMNKILNETSIEFLSMSRTLIREPKIINRWKNGNISPSKCIGCNACYQTPAHKCFFVK